jgi:hypothetical protein
MNAKKTECNRASIKSAVVDVATDRRCAIKPDDSGE